VDPAVVSLQSATSPHSVADTTDRMVAALARRDITVFARIDHAAGARDAGLELADEQLLVFGDPRVGTLLMQEDPAVGYELPMRVLFWDAGGRTMVGWRPPAELAEQYGLAGRAEVLERMAGLLAQLAAEATAA
jgi:uncharacterized protein (DUF302 family)